MNNGRKEENWGETVVRNKKNEECYEKETSNALH
jgi:hypothetical protein